MLELDNMIVVVRSVFHKDNKFHQEFLELAKKW